MIKYDKVTYDLLCIHPCPIKKGPCAPGLGLSECTSDTLLAVRLPNVLPLVGEKDHVEFVILSGCWCGTMEWIMTFYIFGISSSQLTNSYFFRGVGQPPTSCDFIWFLGFHLSNWLISISDT